MAHALRASLSQAWDYFHLIMAGSLIWGISLAVPIAATAGLGDIRVISPLFFALSALTVGPVTIALYGMSDTIARRELPSLGVLFSTLRRYYLRGLLLFLVQTFILGGTLLAAWFYHTTARHWALQALSLLWIYVALFWTMMNLYVPALLVRGDGSLWSALRNGALLTLAHPGYTFLVLFQIGCLLLIVVVPLLARSNLALGVSFMVFFLFLPGFVPLLATNAVNDLLQSYRATSSQEDSCEAKSNSSR